MVLNNANLKDMAKNSEETILNLKNISAGVGVFLIVIEIILLYVSLRKFKISKKHLKEKGLKTIVYLFFAAIFIVLGVMQLGNMNPVIDSLILYAINLIKETSKSG